MAANSSVDKEFTSIKETEHGRVYNNGMELVFPDAGKYLITGLTSCYYSLYWDAKMDILLGDTVILSYQIASELGGKTINTQINVSAGASLKPIMRIYNVDNSQLPSNNYFNDFSMPLVITRIE